MIMHNRAKLCAEGRVRAGARARGTRGGFLEVDADGDQGACDAAAEQLQRRMAAFKASRVEKTGEGRHCARFWIIHSSSLLVFTL